MGKSCGKMKEIIKFKNLFSIISIVIWMVSCNTNSSNNKIERLNIHNSVLKVDSTIRAKEKINKTDSAIITQVNRKKIKIEENKIDKRLKVTIDGKVYYKKSIYDSPVNISPKGYKLSKYYYEYMYNHHHYDIRTGKFLKYDIVIK